MIASAVLPCLYSTFVRPSKLRSFSAGTLFGRGMAPFPERVAGKRWTSPYETSRCLRSFEGLDECDRSGLSPNQSVLDIQGHVRYRWSPSPIADKPSIGEYAQRLQLECRRRGLLRPVRATQVVPR